ncbi:hypothetical protein L3073_12565 [Ancylomarina sp. DW003]|nr:hypothetical protein [Ancylomarina sp. DW003]MDE5423043.1 hypothetical protein [Ancylomarina sp. DW003]
MSTDRDIYIAGENLWFNVGAYELGSNEKSKLSQVIYVELINKKKVPVLQLKTRINKQSSQSHVLIPDTLSTGNYCLRAYTRWMRNKDISLFFKKDISIINPFLANSLPDGDKYFNRDTIFTHPESGMLFPNIENKILIRVLSPTGEGKSVEGYLENNKQSSLIKFKTNSDGLGLLNFVPQDSTDYYYRFNNLRIQLPNISDKKTYLKLKEYGNGTFMFKVYGKATGNLWVDIVEKDGKFINRYSVPEDDVVKVENIDVGIHYALLINEKNDVIGYRAFSNSKQKNGSNIKLIPSKDSYGTRNKVDLNVEGINDLDDITISVVKSCLLNDMEKNEKSIDSNDFLLNLNPPNFIKSTYTNLLLPEVEGELITGYITDIDTGKPIVDEKFMLSFVGQNPILKFSKTDSLGRFKFNVNRYGEEEMVIQPVSNDTLLKYKVNLNDNFAPSYNQYINKKFVLDSIQAIKINEAIVSMQINTLYSAYKVEHAISDSIESLDAFYGKPNISRLIGKYIELPSIEEVVREIVPFTGIRKKNGEYYFRVYEDNSLYPRQCQTLTLMDGVPIKDVKNIFKISPQELKKVDVVNLDFFLQDEELGYLLCFYTRDGNMAEMEFDQRIFRQVHKGFVKNYQYINPDYSDPKVKESRLADYRNVLYYNVFHGNNESLNLDFYTADEETEYTIVVKGVNTKGELVEKRKKIEIIDEIKN